MWDVKVLFTCHHSESTCPIHMCSATQPSRQPAKQPSSHPVRPVHPVGPIALPCRRPQSFHIHFHMWKLNISVKCATCCSSDDFLRCWHSTQCYFHTLFTNRAEYIACVAFSIISFIGRALQTNRIEEIYILENCKFLQTHKSRHPSLFNCKKK